MSLKINHQIKFPEVRIDGIVVSLSEALKQSKEAGLDLICTVEQANPPVCIIEDLASYNYKQKKREKENRKKSSRQETKEIVFGGNIATGDFDRKVKEVMKFLDEGHNVNVLVGYKKGRVTEGMLEILKELIQKIKDSVTNGKVVGESRDGKLLRLNFNKK